jgi:hypothetical protein
MDVLEAEDGASIAAVATPAAIAAPAPSNAEVMPIARNMKPHTTVSSNLDYQCKCAVSSIRSSKLPNLYLARQSLDVCRVTQIRSA